MSDDVTSVERLRLAEAATIAGLEDAAREAREAAERRDASIAAAVYVGMSQAQVARAVGLSRSRVQQIAATTPPPRAG